MIEDQLRNELPDREIATLLAQVIVDPRDPAFARPTKPIDPSYSKVGARRLAASRGWTVGADGHAWRRLVASPEPKRIVEVSANRLLAEAGVIAVCLGGGGIPVVSDEAGGLHGMEAVVDKDLLAALLATALRPDGLVMLTDVDAVYEDWDTPTACPIRSISPAHLRAKRFTAGTMAPKVGAGCRCIEAGDCFAAIGALDALPPLLPGQVGTVITTDAPCLARCAG